jgi:hypothetical protein
MSLNFNAYSFSSIEGIPENLRSLEIYPKITHLIDYVVKNAAIEFENVKYKYGDFSRLDNDTVKEIISELGFNYIKSVMDTISNYDFKILLYFVSLINLLKGSRAGLELILYLLGFNFFIREWWEQSPIKPVYTFEIVVIVNSSIVSNINETLDNIKKFARAYVFPIIENIDFRFSISFVEYGLITAGFSKARYTGNILLRA